MTEDRDESLEERRKRLGAEIASVRKDAEMDEAGEIRAEESRKGYAMAVKLSSEFISAIIVGGLLGYLLDWLAGTSPWGLIVLLLLGFCAGVLNVLRASGKVTTPHPIDRDVHK
ncbi:AtpZ/AtpI family protein [Rhizobium sp. PAMB 3182]|jgi:ATP synthase protein I